MSKIIAVKPPQIAQRKDSPEQMDAPMDGQLDEQHRASDVACELSRELAWQAAAAVVDPEVPVLTVAELGILRAVDVSNDGVAVARVSPTYSGCPAVAVIETAIAQALRAAGFEPRIERVLNPPWTTDWVSELGRQKLEAYGIAPPRKVSTSVRALFEDESIACPRCHSTNTTRVSAFGSTACKSMHTCDACLEPFEAFKCI